jgi:hypothetical protein
MVKAGVQLSGCLATTVNSNHGLVQSQVTGFLGVRLQCPVWNRIFRSVFRWPKKKYSNWLEQN